MPLRPISAARLAAGVLWTTESTYDAMERVWQVFEIPFDWEMVGSFTATAATPAPNTGTATKDIYCVFPDSYDIDDNFAEGMYVELGIHVYLTHSGGPGSIRFQGSDTGSGAGPAGWKKPTKQWTSSLPTGLTTQTLQLTAVAQALPPAAGSAAATRTYAGDSPDSYIRIAIPDAAGIAVDDTVIEVGDESELPTPSATWRGVRAYLKAPAGVQDKSWYCMKGYDDNYYWVPFVAGGGGL